MSEELIIIGGGEHARVLAEAARSRGIALAGFVDPRPCAAMQALGVRHLGDDAAALAKISSCVFIVGVGVVGVSDTRQRIALRYAQAGARFAVVAHERAVISPSATVAPGAALFAGAIVNAGAKIGAHAIVNTGAVVEHDVDLGAFVHLGPAAALGGGAEIGEGAYLGLGCRVRDHVRIGARTTVGMGAVVVGPIGDGAVALGCPARERGA